MTQVLPLYNESQSGQSPATDISRRSFIGGSSAVLISALLAQACGGGADSVTGVNAPVIPPPAGSVTFANGVLTLNLPLLPDLTAVNGHQVLSVSDATRSANLIVINVGDGYRAFTSICTHEGCTVSGYANQRMICPCHGSEYNTSGVPVAGPAPSALREFPITVNSAAQTLTIAT